MEVSPCFDISFRVPDASFPLRAPGSGKGIIQESHSDTLTQEIA